MFHKWFATNTFAEFFFYHVHLWTLANVLEYSNELSTSFYAFKLLRLPDFVAEKELTLLKVANLILAEVLLCLSEELDKDNAWEIILLRAYPISMLNQDLNEMLVHKELKMVCLAEIELSLPI